MDIKNLGPGSHVVWIQPSLENHELYIDIGRGVIVGVTAEGNVVCKFKKFSVGFKTLMLRSESLIGLPACPACGGSGVVPNYIGVRTCFVCWGYGYTRESARGHYEELPDYELDSLYSRAFDVPLRPGSISREVLINELTQNDGLN